MGCAKSVPDASNPKKVASIKVGSKFNNAIKNSTKQNQAQQGHHQNNWNDYREENQNVSDNKSDNESISSRKNRKTELNLNQQSEQQQQEKIQLQNNANNLAQQENLAYENEELLLKQKLEENENKFIKNLRYQESLHDLEDQNKQDYSNMFQNDFNKNNNNNDSGEDNKENVFQQSNNHDQHIPTLSTKAYGKQDSTGENYCNILRQKSSNLNGMNSGISLGSMTMLNSGQRLQNTNIITSGIDFEKKKRELVRKISDEIDEIDEIDENNYQFGATSQKEKQKEAPKLNSLILKTKKIDLEEEDENNSFLNSNNQKPSAQNTNSKTEPNQGKNNQDDDDEF